MSAEYGYYRFPTVSGNTIVFVCEDDLWSVPVDGGVAHRLTANPGAVMHPRFSPDGSRIAFTGRDEGQHDVYVMDSDGGPARRLTFFGTTTLPVAWSPSGETVVVSTDWNQPFAGWMHLVEVPLDGGAPRPLGLGPARGYDQAPRGRGRVLGRFGREPAQWKRYRGGRAGTVWIDRDGDGRFERLTRLPGNLASPMWIGRRIFFLSDHEGHANLYSVTPTGRNLERHTHHETFFARWPTTDGATIAYHVGADVWVHDMKAGDARRLDIRIPSARPQRNRRFQSPGRHLESVRLHPRGHSLAVVARGNAVTMPLWEGAPVRHGAGSAVRERLAAWMADGRRIVAITDEAGEEALVVRHADGSGDPVVTKGDFGRARELAAAPAGSDRVAVTNHRHEVMLVNLERQTTRVLHRSPYSWIHGVAWSPDGRWLAFSSSTSPTTAALFISDTRTGRVRQVTRSEFSDVRPAFDPDGKYLYFLSTRTFEPVADAIFHDYGFPTALRPYLLVLDAATPSPFLVEQREPRPPGAPAPDAAAKPADRPETSGPPEVAIGFAGLGDRVAAVPVPAARYGRVLGAAGRVLFSSYPLQATPDPSKEGPRGKVEAWDFAADKLETVAEGVADFGVSADGKVVALLGRGKLRVVPSAAKAGEKNGPDKPARETGWVDLERIRIEVVPGDEWAQMFSEAWRLQRDYFWREDMAEVAWTEVHRRYRPLVDRVASRAEFSDLLWEMQGELGTSHAYELGGDYLPEPPWKQGSLGVDLERDGRGVWRIGRIPQGDPWDPKAASPLAGPGVDIRTGDRLVAVDGRSVDRVMSPYEALADRAGRSVQLTLRRGRTRPRTLTVTALSSEFALRYRDWVNANRAAVHEMSGGRAGYLHIPDMGPAGFAEFHRSWMADLDHDGLVIDVRFNRGGNVSQLLLQKLLRKRLGYRITRWNDPVGFPYGSPMGPMVALTNEYCGSDGDIFSHTFKWHGLGPLIGTRTWGGVTGIWPQQALVDGTITTQPEFGTWFSDVGYEVENYGTDPTIEVVVTPQDHAAGRDPQLERGVTELLAIIEAAEPLVPDFGSHPSMRPPRLPGGGGSASR